jgi:hypothetical protein
VCRKAWILKRRSHAVRRAEATPFRFPVNRSGAVEAKRWNVGETTKL